MGPVQVFFIFKRFAGKVFVAIRLNYQIDDTANVLVIKSALPLNSINFRETPKIIPPVKYDEMKDLIRL